MRSIRPALAVLTLATALGGCAYGYPDYSYRYPYEYYGYPNGYYASGYYAGYPYRAYPYRYEPFYAPYYRDSNPSPAGGGGNG